MGRAEGYRNISHVFGDGWVQIHMENPFCQSEWMRRLTAFMFVCVHIIHNHTHQLVGIFYVFNRDTSWSIPGIPTRCFSSARTSNPSTWRAMALSRNWRRSQSQSWSWIVRATVELFPYKTLCTYVYIAAGPMLDLSGQHFEIRIVEPLVLQMKLETLQSHVRAISSSELSLAFQQNCLDRCSGIWQVGRWERWVTWSSLAPSTADRAACVHPSVHLGDFRGAERVSLTGPPNSLNWCLFLFVNMGKEYVCHEILWYPIFLGIKKRDCMHLLKQIENMFLDSSQSNILNLPILSIRIF